MLLQKKEKEERNIQRKNEKEKRVFSDKKRPKEKERSQRARVYVYTQTGQPATVCRFSDKREEARPTERPLFSFLNTTDRVLFSSIRADLVLFSKQKGKARSPYACARIRTQPAADIRKQPRKAQLPFSSPTRRLQAILWARWIDFTSDTFSCHIGAFTGAGERGDRPPIPPQGIRGNSRVSIFNPPI